MLLILGGIAIVCGAVMFLRFILRGLDEIGTP